MSTRHDEMLPALRVFLGDLKKAKYQDDDLLPALRVATFVVQILGYDRGHTSDLDGVSPDLTEKEKIIWAKTASVLVNDPAVFSAAVDAVTVRTLGTTYSTEAGARFTELASSREFLQLRMFIRAFGDPLVGTRDNLDIDTLP